MYWACFNNATGAAAVIYSATDPQEISDEWDETYCYETQAEAEAALDAD